MSAYSEMSRTGRFDDSASVITGMALGSNLETVGGSIPAGRSGMPLILFWISCAATSMFFSRTNWTITIETLSAEVDDRWSIPLTELTASSILLVTSLSISSGEAPGSVTVTTMMGMSTLGQRSMFNFA